MRPPLPPSRFRRVAKWVGLVVCIPILGFWMLSVIVLLDMGFSVRREAFWQVNVGFLFPLALFAIPTYILWRRDRRTVGEGYCKKCCYDLRGSTEKCPECGTEFYRLGETDFRPPGRRLRWRLARALRGVLTRHACLQSVHVTSRGKRLRGNEYRFGLTFDTSIDVSFSDEINPVVVAIYRGLKKVLGPTVRVSVIILASLDHAPVRDARDRFLRASRRIYER